MCRGDDLIYWFVLIHIIDRTTTCYKRQESVYKGVLVFNHCKLVEQNILLWFQHLEYATKVTMITLKFFCQTATNNTFFQYITSYLHAI